MHWAADLIGAPWAADGVGPRAFSCWGLVRHFFGERLGIEMPHIAVDAPSDEASENVRAIKQAAQASGWRPIESTKPQENDVVLMRSATRLHCGVVTRANGRLCVLHSSHSYGVVCQPWHEALSGMQAELWRATR